jgi:predicted nucleic acid-binding protein
LDTAVLVAALRTDDPRHHKATRYLEALREDATLAVPASTLLEFDLLAKARGYSEEERHTTWLELAPKIPGERVIPPTGPVFARAAELQRQGLTYFDALLAAQALESQSRVVTHDRALATRVPVEW